MERVNGKPLAAWRGPATGALGIILGEFLFSFLSGPVYQPKLAATFVFLGSFFAIGASLKPERWQQIEREGVDAFRTLKRPIVSLRTIMKPRAKDEKLTFPEGVAAFVTLGSGILAVALVRRGFQAWAITAPHLESYDRIAILATISLIILVVVSDKIGVRGRVPKVILELVALVLLLLTIGYAAPFLLAGWAAFAIVLYLFEFAWKLIDALLEWAPKNDVASPFLFIGLSMIAGGTLLQFALAP